MIGNKILKFDKIDSTNSYIKNNINKFNHGDIVISKVQTKGRGRFGNTWISSGENLYFSFVSKNELNRENIFQHIMKTSVAIVRLLNNYKIECKIKFPNDIIVDTKKISGILIETLGYNKIYNVIIGVGLNVNQYDFNELNKTATSIGKITNKQINLMTVLNQFIDIFNNLSNKKEIYNEYLKHLYLMNKFIDYKEKKYKIKTIDYYGNIVLKNDIRELVINFSDISLSHLYE